MFLIALVIVFGFFVISVHAQTEVDRYFENVRGELFGFYGSELVSHAAILLGLLVAFPSSGWRAFRNVGYREGYKRWWAFFFNLVYLFIFIAMVLVIFYFVGRAIVWAFVSSRLASATPANLGITESNVTSSMNALADYASGVLKGAAPWSQPFIISVNPPENYIPIFAFVSTGTSIIGSIMVTSYRRSRRLSRWLHFQTSVP